MKTDRLLPLDGLRGIAILTVILLHAGIWRGGGVGVDLFFVLSGFLITGILLDAKAAASTWQDYAWPFYVRRALRIFPVAFTALTLVFVVAPIAGLWPAAPFREQVWFWTYLSNWYAGPRSFAVLHLQHFWSLAVEEQFYLIWPLVMWHCSSRTVTRVCGVIVILVPILRMLVTVWHVPVSATVAALAPTVLRFDGLAAGAWLAVAARQPGGLGRWRPFAWCCLPLGVLLLRLTGDFSGAILIFAAALIAAVTVDPRDPLSTFLTWRPLRWVGRVSYVVYIVHFPIAARLLGAGVSPPIILVVTVAVSLLIAAASWRWFEQPILAHKSRWPMPRAIPQESSSLPTGQLIERRILVHAHREP